MKIKRIAGGFFRLLDALVRSLFLAAVIVVLLYALYVMLDTAKLVADAGSGKYQTYKPTAEDTLSFDELRAMNPDVRGWLTLDDTPVDYPVVQGEDNNVYLNRDVEGEFSLSGAIFLDSRCADDLSDPLNVIYGHNIAGDVMFGSLRHFAEPDYFAAHRTGSLYWDGAYYDLSVFACCKANGHDPKLYAVGLKADQAEGWLAAVKAAAVQQSELPGAGERFLLLSTCAAGMTDERTLLALTLSPGTAPETPSATERAWVSLLRGVELPRDGAALLPWWIGLLALALLLTWLEHRAKKRRRRRMEHG